MIFFDKNIAYILLILGLFVASSCSKDSPTIAQKEKFVKSFGEGYDDIAIDFIKDDNHYYILGNLRSSNEFDSTRIFLTKTDEYGNAVWDKFKEYTIDNKNTEAGQIIKLKKSNSLAIVGSIESDDTLNYMDVFLLIIDEDGNVLNDTTYNAIDNGIIPNEFGQNIGEYNDTSLIVTCNIYENQTFTKGFILFINQKLEITVKKPQPNLKLNNLGKRNQNAGFYATFLNTYHNYPGVLAIGSNGGSFPVYHEEIDGEIKGIVESSNGETFICGYENGNGTGKTNGFVAKLTSPELRDNTEWKRKSTNNGLYNHIEVDNNNNIYLAGIISGADSDDNLNIWVVKTDIFGNTISERNIGGKYNESGLKILNEGDNSFSVLATTYLGNNSYVTLYKSQFQE